MMRISLVTSTLQFGGAETQLVRLARELHGLGHTVEVIHLLDGGPLGATLDAAGVPRYCPGQRAAFVRRGRLIAPDPRALLAYIRLVRHFRAFRPDVCHAQLPDCNAVALPLAWVARVPGRIGGRLGQTSTLHTNASRKSVARVVGRFATAMIANARFLADEVASDERIDPRRIRVVPNGVDIPGVRLKTASGTSAPFQILVIANLIGYKGHADLLRALTMLTLKPAVRFAGEGPERGVLERLTNELGLAAQVEFLGTVPNAARLYADADIAVLPSHTEGLPNAVLEAMAAGLPVIATAVGGIPDLITNGVDGILVAPRAPVEIATAIEQICHDHALRERLGSSARRRAEDFSWRRCAQAHLAVYREFSDAPGHDPASVSLGGMRGVAAPITTAGPAIATSSAGIDTREGELPAVAGATGHARSL